MTGLIAQAFQVEHDRVTALLAGIRADEGAARRAETPGELACALDPRTVQTKALRLIDARIVATVRERSGRLLLTMPPQEGKSNRVSLYTPLWLLKDNRDLRICIASYESDLSTRWGRYIRNMIRAHPELGLRVRRDTAAAHEWQLEGNHPHPTDPGKVGRPYDGGVICVGIGGAVTGRPVDVLIIDDPVKGKLEASSEAHRKHVWEWWTDSARPRLAPGAPVVLIMTRFHEDDLGGRLRSQDAQPWEVLNIPARADHRPEKGETDPLGRDPGEWMESARGKDRHLTDWEPIEANTPSTFAALYQGKPAPAEGVLLKRDHWQFYDVHRYTLRDGGSHWVMGKPDDVIQSWDMAFKDTKASDYVVGQVWARWGLDAYLLWQIRARLSFTKTCEALVDAAKMWPQARRKLIEDKANGTAVMNILHKTVTGMVPVTPTDGKYQRAVAVSPFIESRHVYLPAESIAPWVAGFVDECAVFPNSTNDDQVDATTQALERLLGNLTTAKVHRPPPQTGIPTGFGAAMGNATWGTGRQFRR